MKATLAEAQPLQHYRAMSFTPAHCRIANPATRGRVSVVVNNNRNNASLPQAGD